MGVQRPHYVQLAGGTNNHSAQIALEAGLTGRYGFGGYAFGGYARKRIGERLHDLDQAHPNAKIEDYPAELEACVALARALVGTVKPHR